MRRAEGCAVLITMTADDASHNLALWEAVVEHCTCGGGGPQDAETCPACRIWHTMGGVPPGQVEVEADKP